MYLLSLAIDSEPSIKKSVFYFVDCKHFHPKTLYFTNDKQIILPPIKKIGFTHLNL